MLTTNDKDVYERVVRLRNHGLETRESCAVWGHNSRLDSIQAAILLVKLKYLEKWTELRRHHASFYQQALGDLEELQVPKDAPFEHAVYHTFMVQADRREELRRHLEKSGVASVISYPTPIHLQEAAAALCYKSGSLPVTERQASRILNLPIYSELENDQLGYVVDCIRSFYQAH